mmetsp:Transcript_38652/g.81279  ORF Transcript_38652/g.81279 Transcript_38652/m.81279 type:complete len:230 (-) Transcript_38652:82-771(-)
MAPWMIMTTDKTMGISPISIGKSQIWHLLTFCLLAWKTEMMKRHAHKIRLMVVGIMNAIRNKKRKLREETAMINLIQFNLIRKENLSIPLTEELSMDRVFMECSCLISPDHLCKHHQTMVYYGEEGTGFQMKKLGLIQMLYRVPMTRQIMTPATHVRIRLPSSCWMFGQTKIPGQKESKKAVILIISITAASPRIALPLISLHLISSVGSNGNGFGPHWRIAKRQSISL